MFSSTYPYPVSAFKLSIFKFHNTVIQLQLQESELRQSPAVFTAPVRSASPIEDVTPRDISPVAEAQGSAASQDQLDS